MAKWDEFHQAACIHSVFIDTTSNTTTPRVGPGASTPAHRHREPDMTLFQLPSPATRHSRDTPHTPHHLYIRNIMVNNKLPTIGNINKPRC